MAQARDFVDGYILVTRNGSLYRQHPATSASYSVFASRENAAATNAGALKGTGTVFRLAKPGLPRKFVAGLYVVDEG